MRIGIVGASSAGLYAAILIKKKHPDFDVVLLEKNEKIGRKLLATGNGHCNLLNLSASAPSFYQEEFLKPYFERHSISDLADVLNSLGVPFKKIGDLAYPLSFSAEAYVEHLKNLCFNLGIKIKTGTRVIDYSTKDGHLLKTDSGDWKFDKLIFATGGMSQKNLGSDGSLFSVFAKHGLTIIELNPGLCPIKTKEKTKDVAGVRHDASVSLIVNGKKVYEEDGEVIFKDDGLSGIVIFNCESYIVHHKLHGCRIELDLFPDYSAEQLNKMIEDSSDLKSILPIKLGNYLKARCPKDEDFGEFIKHVPFAFDQPYPFEQSQVTIGGLSLKGLNYDLSYPAEENVHFIGEMLDVDGPCGGFNLTWCLLSALIVAESL